MDTILDLVGEQCESSMSGAVEVLSYNFSPVGQEVWRRIPAFCRFLVTDIPNEATPDPLPFTRGASFIPANSKALRASPKSYRRAVGSDLEDTGDLSGCIQQ